MPTQASSGRSIAQNTEEACREALQVASRGLSSPPTFGVVFASAAHSLATVQQQFSAQFPGLPMISCQTAGEYTEVGLTKGGLNVLLVSSDEINCISEISPVAGYEPEVVAANLCAGFEENSLAAKKLGYGLSSTVLLLDCLQGNGDRIVKALQKQTRMFQNIVGGAAGDDGAFQKPWVGSDTGTLAQGAAALHLFYRQPWGVGVGHGLTPRTPNKKVTKASGNIVYEIDGKPAFEAYREYAKTKGIDLEPETAASFMIGNELGVFLMNKLHHARAPVKVGSSGELHLVAELDTGAQVCILDGCVETMVAGCHDAAIQAREGLGGKKAAAILVFDCVCRGMILGDQFQMEIDALREVFPDTPILGFLTYGEIARTGGRLDGWHNTTSVVVAIPS